MYRAFARRPSPAMVVAVLALFVSLGGSAFAALNLPKDSVGTTQLKNRAVTGAKLANNAVTSSKVHDHSLLAKDFKAGQVPRGPRGPRGATGARGADGSRGLPGPSTGPAGGALSGSYPNPTIADGAITDAKVAAANKDGAASTPSLRTLGPGAQQALPGNGKASNSDLLDGLDSTAFVQGSGVMVHSAQIELAPGSSTSVNTGLATIQYSCPATITDPGTITLTYNSSGNARRWFSHAGGAQDFGTIGSTPETTSAAAAGDHVTIGLIEAQILNPRTVVADVFSGNDSGFDVCSVLFRYTAT